jgi:hypothetical protein
MKFLIKLVLPLMLLSTSSCIHVSIKGAGAFEGARSRNDERYSVAIPKGFYNKVPQGLSFNPGDGSKIDFYHLGRCGSQLSFTGIMIPIIPFWLPNFCETDGFYISPKWGLDTLGVTLQLRYNSTTYDPYIDNGSVKFKIENFSSFKSAPDKTLILHKQNPDGTIFTKELPFDWKVVVEITGGL